METTGSQEAPSKKRPLESMSIVAATAPQEAAPEICHPPNSKSLFGDFEFSLRRQQDPLQVETFSRWGQPVPCLPMVWVYGSKVAMPMAVPFVMIECPVPEALPEELSKCGKDNVEVWALVHSAPQRAPCQKASHDLIGEVSLDEINISHHAWLLPGLDAALAAEPDLSVVTDVLTGVLGANGASEMHQDLTCVGSRGMPFNRLDSREVTVHGGGSFSPCNNMLRLSASHIFHHFTTVSVGRRQSSEGEREVGAMVLHIIPAHEPAELRLRKLLESSRGLSDVCAAIGTVDASAGDALMGLLKQSAPNIMARVEVPIQQQRELFVASLSGLAALEPWQPPSAGRDDTMDGTADSGDALLDEIEAALGQGGDVVALAAQMMDLGCPDFDMNMEVLANTGGNLEAALQFLRPVKS